MASTPYQEENGEYSNKVHQVAQRLIYPKLFQVHEDALTYEEDTLLTESIRGQVLDGEMGIDRVVRVSVQKLTGTIPFTIQERFRRPAYAGYRDITITEWNHRSDQPSELYKIRANIFLYGYADSDEHPTGFSEAIAIDTTQLLVKITRQEIRYSTKRNSKDQTFLAFTFDDLERAGVVIWRDRNLSDPTQALHYVMQKYGQEWVNQFVSVATNQGSAP